MNKIIPTLFFCLLHIFNCFGETKSTNHPYWPLEINSRKAFDVASKCEMLVFIEAFNSIDSLPVLNLPINVKNITESSVNLWKKETKRKILLNFSRLSNESLKEIVEVNKLNSWNSLSEIKLQNVLPDTFSIWYKHTKKFYSNYINEQIKLSALFPRITSEILQFSKNEIQGHEFKDMNFLLTFDDGPTHVNGNTDKLIHTLNQHQLTGIFFVLGDRIIKRLEATSIKSVKKLYGKNLICSHGKTHIPHQKYENWKNSINYTNDIIHKISPTKNNLVYFRPPYGQRNKKISAYFVSNDSKIILWNIDSRDWNTKLSTQQITNRTIKLMLLWRKGILLFHDIHSRVQKIVPNVNKYFKNGGITWVKADEFLNQN